MYLKLMRSLAYLLLLAFCSFFVACTEEIKIAQFDKNAWKKDKNACQGIRTKLAEELKKNKDVLLRASQNQILALLGKPDKVNLGERTQRYYLYYYTPSPKCKNAAVNPKILQLRFSAIDLLTEVVFEE